MIKGIGKAGKTVRPFVANIEHLKNFTSYKGKTIFHDAMRFANVTAVHVDPTALRVLNEDANGIADRIVGGLNNKAKIGDVLVNSLKNMNLEAAIATHKQKGLFEVFIAGDKTNMDYMAQGGMGIVFANSIKGTHLQGELFAVRHEEEGKTVTLNGMTLVAGVGIGKTYLYYGPFHGIEVKEDKIPADKVDMELERFAKTCAELEQHYRSRRSETEKEFGETHVISLIARSFSNILKQEKKSIKKIITKEHCNAEFAVQKVFMPTISTLKESNFEGKQFEIDHEGVMADLITSLSGRHPERLKHLQEEDIILIADHILPQDALSMKNSKIKAIVVQKGGTTSHGAIIANTMGIPCIQINDVMKTVIAGQKAIVNGEKSFMTLNPEPQALEDAETRIKVLHIMNIAIIKEMKGQEAVLLSGERIRLFANISEPADLEHALIYGAEGVGLYRTDFQMGELFKRIPSFEDVPPEQLVEIEDQLVNDYLKVANIIKGLPVIGERIKPSVTIRTFDWGRDKRYGKSEGSALGVSGVRVYDFHKALIMMQLRAILRASAEQPELIRIMFPFIAGYIDVISCKNRLENAKRELCQRELAKNKITYNDDPYEVLAAQLEKNNIKEPFNPKMPVGIMVEIPSAAIEMPQLIEEVDFASYGTNDLIQLMRAADRENEHVQAYYKLMVPAVFFVLKYGIEVADKAKKEVSICGEMASNLVSIPPLIGMGFTTLSMSQNNIPAVKKLIRTLDMKKCAALASIVVKCKTSEDATGEVIKKYLELGKKD
jgi:phosphotransferase system enzyme I (PtsI)